MTQECPDFETLSAFADGEDVEDRSAVGAHVERCGMCRETLADIAAADDVLRREAAAAPTRLRSWLEQRAMFERARGLGGVWRPSRRALLAGGAATAAALGVALMTRPRPLGAGNMAPTLFQDFATRVAADKALDFPSPDFRRVADWLDARLPFLAPRPPALQRVALRGGRLCWLLDRRVAAIHFKHVEKETCFYVAEAQGLTLTGERRLPGDGAPPALLSGSGASGAFWRRGSLAYALVSASTSSEIETLAFRMLG